MLERAEVLPRTMMLFNEHDVGASGRVDRAGQFTIKIEDSPVQFSNDGSDVRLGTELKATENCVVGEVSSGHAVTVVKLLALNTDNDWSKYRLTNDGIETRLPQRLIERM